MDCKQSLTESKLISIYILLDDGTAGNETIPDRESGNTDQKKSLKTTLDTLKFKSMVRLLAATTGNGNVVRKKEFENNS